MKKAIALGLVVCQTMFSCHSEQSSSLDLAYIDEIESTHNSDLTDEEAITLDVSDIKGSRSLKIPKNLLLDPLSVEFPTFNIDSNPTTAIESIFSAKNHIEFFDSNSQSISVYRTEVGFVYYSQTDIKQLDKGRRVVRFSKDLKTLYYQDDQEAVEVRFSGVPAAQLDRFIAIQIIAMLDLTASPDASLRLLDPVTGSIVVVGMAAVSYITCLTGGQALCSKSARNGCGAGKVGRFKMVCGIGRDLEGKFHFGSNCSYKCKG